MKDRSEVVFFRHLIDCFGLPRDAMRKRGTCMGGAAGTAGTAAAVPLFREVRQNKVLPYHILVKNSQIYR